MGEGQYGDRFLAVFSLFVLALESCSCFHLAETNHAQRTWTIRQRQQTSTPIINPSLGKHSMGRTDRHTLSAGWYVYRLRSSSVAARASGGEGNQGSGSREDGQSEQWEPADSADTNEHTSMELRDFRARLLAKGLDGWGAQDDGGANDSAEPVSGGDERQVFALLECRAVYAALGLHARNSLLPSSSTVLTAGCDPDRHAPLQHQGICTCSSDSYLMLASSVVPIRKIYL